MESLSRPLYNDDAKPSSSWTPASMLLRTARHVLYMVMLFLRIPFRMISTLSIIPLLLGGVAWGLIAGWTSMPALMLTTASFGIFVALYLYDTLLLLISPEPLYLDI